MKPIKVMQILAVLLCIAMLIIPVGQAQKPTVLSASPSVSNSEVNEPPITWIDTYGDDDLFARDIIETSDGNYTVTGQYQFFVGSLEGGAIYLLKVGADGEKLGQTFDSYGIGRFYSGEFIQQTEDNGSVVAGTGTERLFKYFYLAKYDADGNILWSKTYRPVGGNCTCTGATGTPDGGFLLIGYTQESSGAEYVYVVKTDARGNMEWESIISDPACLGDTGGIPRSVTNAPGGYAITGEVYDETTEITSAFLLRLNTFGKAITRKHYEFSLSGARKTDIDGFSIQYTNDGFIIAGSAYGYGIVGFSRRAAFLLKVSTNGNVRWLKTYGLDTFSTGYSVCQTRDGGYIVAGTTNNYDPSSPIYAYIVRTDSSGNELWNKTIRRYAVSAGNKIISTSDGGYIMAGMAVRGGVADTLVVKIAPEIVPKK